MRVFSTPEPLKKYISDNRGNGKEIGLVPTMGALHQGHLQLISKSIQDNSVTVSSIYVNPTQFNNQTDLKNYPRDLGQDILKLKKSGCQAAFCPSDEVMYPQKPLTTLNFDSLEEVMEGAYRPGHFQGVALAVSKLFHFIQPDRAYFGQKDWQQLVIIRQLVNDLGFAIDIVGVPTLREADGLAMSSRNQRLNHNQRTVASELYRAISLVKMKLEKLVGVDEARQMGVDYLRKFSSIHVEYLEVVHSTTLKQPMAELGSEPLSVCIAGLIGDIRLIDNVQVFQTD